MNTSRPWCAWTPLMAAAWQPHCRCGVRPPADLLLLLFLVVVGQGSLLLLPVVIGGLAVVGGGVCLVQSAGPRVRPVLPLFFQAFHSCPGCAPAARTAVGSPA